MVYDRQMICALHLQMVYGLRMAYDHLLHKVCGRGRQMIYVRHLRMVCAHGRQKACDLCRHMVCDLRMIYVRALRRVDCCSLCLILVQNLDAQGRLLRSRLMLSCNLHAYLQRFRICGIRTPTNR